MFAKNQTSVQAPTVYYGVYLPEPSDFSSLDRFETDAGKKVAIVMRLQDWSPQQQSFPADWLDAIRNRGSIPMISWVPADPVTPLPEKLLQNIINGQFDALFTQWALGSKAWGHPYFLRFAHEMNGDWFPWSEQKNGNKGQFVPAWRHVHGIFTANGVTNVTWVWCPSIDADPLANLYPGDDYVDWLGMDGYNWGTSQPWGSTWQTFSQLFGQTYTEITALSAKPLMIAEFASAEKGGNKAQWITDALSSEIL